MRSASSRLSQYVQQCPVFKTDGKVLYCKLCEKGVSADKVFNVKQQLKTAKHVELMNKSKAKNLVQPLMGEYSTNICAMLWLPLIYRYIHCVIKTLCHFQKSTLCTKCRQKPLFEANMLKNFMIRPSLISNTASKIVSYGFQLMKLQMQLEGMWQTSLLEFLIEMSRLQSKSIC